MASTSTQRGGRQYRFSLDCYRYPNKTVLWNETDTETAQPPECHGKTESDLLVPFRSWRSDRELKALLQLADGVPFATVVEKHDTLLPPTVPSQHSDNLLSTIQKCNAESLLNNIQKIVGKSGNGFPRKLFCHQTDIKSNELMHKLILVTDSKEETFVLLQSTDKIHCLRIRPTTTDVKLHQVVRSFAKSSKVPGKYTIFCNGRRLTVQELRTLPNLATVRIVGCWAVIWTIRCQCTPHTEHNCRLTVQNVDSLQKVKETFRNILGSELKMSPLASPDEIWFTHNGKVLSDKVLQDLFDISFTGVSVDIQGGCKHEMLAARKACMSQTIALTKLYVDVHFQPSDAVAIPVFRDRVSRWLTKQEFVIVVPRNVSTSQLRLEVSKRAQFRLGALEIKIGKTKLENLTDLQHNLCAPNCSISYTLKPVNIVTVEIFSMPDRCNVWSGNVRANLFDTVVELKALLGAQMNVPVHKLDLVYRGRLLQDEMSIGDCEIPKDERIKAHLYNNRISLILHVLPGSKRIRADVFVDSISTVTVRDVKQFSRSLEPTFAKCHDSEISAFFQNRFLDCDQNTLLEVGISADVPKQRVVLKLINSLCFSASSVAPSETFIIFQDSGGNRGRFESVATMTNGYKLFFAPSLKITQRVRMGLLRIRQVKTRCVQGIRRCRRSPLHEDGSLTGCPHLSQRKVATDPHPRTTNAINTQVAPSRTSRETADKAVNTIKDRRVRFDTDVEGSRPLLLDKAGDTSPECTVTTAQQSVNRLDSEKHSTPPQRRDAELTTEAIRTSSRSSETLPEDCQITEGTSGTRAKKRTAEKELTISKSPHSSSLMHRRSGSESDDGRKRRKLSRTTVTEESMEESEQEEGLWKVCKQITSTYFVEGPAAESQQRNLMMASTSGGYGYPHENHIVPNGHEVVEDSKYKYIDREIILAVARELGYSGDVVIRQLGVPDHIISAVEARHSKNMVSFHLECLVKWCEIKTIDANPYNLKKALADNDRNDLVDLVDNFLSKKTA